MRTILRLGPLLCAVLASLPLAAAAQNEIVTVAGQDTLTGFWKMTIPESMGTMNMVTFEFGEMRERYCRVEQKKSDLLTYCLGEYFLQKGAA